jgi:serine/threonine protein kinase
MGCNGSKENVSPSASLTTSLHGLPSNPADLFHHLPSSIPFLNLEDFQIQHLLACGGVGIVYSAQHLITKQLVALKFFGYVQKPVNLQDLFRELELFAAVSGLEGVVQLHGVGVDSPRGYLTEQQRPQQKKQYHQKVSEQVRYPVICMDLLEGGDLFDLIQATKFISERFISRIIFDIIYALDGLHQRGYLHCDLKLENVMFTRTPRGRRGGRGVTRGEEEERRRKEGRDREATSPQVKLIDFGMMVRLPASGGVYTTQTVHGTPGYVAPESLTRGEYSPKSDIWQVGCVLFSLLSGFQAFDPSSPHRTISGAFQPMEGEGWENISSAAKELLTRIFVTDPVERLSCQEILNHRWVRGAGRGRQRGGALPVVVAVAEKGATNEETAPPETTEEGEARESREVEEGEEAAPDKDLGESYHRRIKQLALGQTLKRVFQDRDIVQITKETKEKLRRILPLLVENKRERVTRTQSNIIRTSRTSSPRSLVARPFSSAERGAEEKVKITLHKKHSTPSIFVHSSSLALSATAPPVSLGHSALELRRHSLDDLALVPLTTEQQRRYLEVHGHGEEEEGGKQKGHSHCHWSAENELGNKISNLKVAFVHHAVGRRGRHQSGRLETEAGEILGGEGEYNHREVDFNGFIALLRDCDLGELATPQMFHIFGLFSSSSSS